MLLFEIVKVAMSAITTNVLRSVLTTLGIVIGVGAVITMVSLGEGAQMQVEEQINRMGTSVLTIRPGQEFSHGVSRGDTRMSIEDAEALRNETRGLLKISPELQSRMQVTYLRWNSNNQVMGVWPDYFEIYDHGLISGRYFTEGEVRGRRRVAILGYSIPERLGEIPTDSSAYPIAAALLIGKTIQVRGIPFEVIGV
ncbi:MAG TPA: multidrug ABC transporter substrate-binding protein, partial [Gemmatimonadetes bacterium]|nr:multidrug ABC transporter substrate-binding protein [Gemmatimonadota bacterium]